MKTFELKTFSEVNAGDLILVNRRCFGKDNTDILYAVTNVTGNTYELMENGEMHSLTVDPTTPVIIW